MTNPNFSGASPAEGTPASARPFAPSTPARKGLTPGRFLLALALVILIACGGTTTATNSGSNTPAPAGSSQAPTGPGASAADPAPLGTEVEAAKGWTIKVTAANLNADAAVKKAASYMSPKPGQRYVTVDLAATNGSGKPDVLSYNTKLTLLGSTGVAHERSYVSQYPKELDPSAQLQPGITVSGVLVFEVPADEVDSLVLLAEPQFTLDENEDQRFLALK